MHSSSGPTSVLEYHRTTRSVPVVVWWLLPLGAAPFAIEVVAIVCEWATGDPPNGLGEFKAYHYAVGSAALIAVGWFMSVACKFRNHHRRWVLLVCGSWCVWVLGVGFWFLREVHRHPAGQYYWSRW